MRRPTISFAALVLLALGGCATQGTVQPTADVVGAVKDAARGPSIGEEDRAWVLAQAKSALESGNHLAAYTGFSQILEQDRENADALVGLGEALLLGGQPEKALGVFAKLEKVSDRDGVSLQGQGLALYAMEDYAKSEMVFEKALKADPKLWRAWNALGSIKDRAGLGEEARRYYDRALEIDPDATVAMNNKGMSFMLERKYAEAEREFKDTLKRDPQMAPARTNLRLALAWQGKYVEALTGASKTEMPVVLNNIGYIAARRGDYDFAEAYLAQAIQMSPSYYARAAENLELVKQLRNADKTNKRDLVQKKNNN